MWLRWFRSLSLGIYHADKQYVIGTGASTSIEETAEVSDNGARWIQPYWLKNEEEEVTVSMLKLAKKAGFTALVLTLHTYILGWRPSDLDNSSVTLVILVLHKHNDTNANTTFQVRPLSPSRRYR
jgi:isopentenyl diphosphate isomerase/L-lactate dehydrogenase-like FMN-dependent dehydrogenase